MKWAKSGPLMGPSGTISRQKLGGGAFQKPYEVFPDRSAPPDQRHESGENADMSEPWIENRFDISATITKGICHVKHVLNIDGPITIAVEKKGSRQMRRISDMFDGARLFFRTGGFKNIPDAVVFLWIERKWPGEPDKAGYGLNRDTYFLQISGHQKQTR